MSMRTRTRQSHEDCSQNGLVHRPTRASPRSTSGAPRRRRLRPFTIMVGPASSMMHPRAPTSGTSSSNVTARPLDQAPHFYRLPVLQPGAHWTHDQHLPRRLLKKPHGDWLTSSKTRRPPPPLQKCPAAASIAVASESSHRHRRGRTTTSTPP